MADMTDVILAMALSDGGGGGGSGAGVVRYSVEQNLTDAQKQTAKSNIGAAGETALASVYDPNDTQTATGTTVFVPGQHFMYKGELYMAVENIEQGDEIEPGENAIVISVDELVLEKADDATFRDAIANQFSDSVDYKKGDYVWYNGVLCLFDRDHAAGEWDDGDVVTDAPITNYARDAGAVRFDEAQALTDAQKTQARANIGVDASGGSTDGLVRYDAAQSLTDVQKGQARTNIAAASLVTTGESYYTELLRIDGFNISGLSQTYAVDWHAGDTIRVDYATDDPGHYLTIVTVLNGTNKDYFVQTTSASASGTAEITLSVNADHVKVYATLTNQYRYVDIAFFKKNPASALGATLVELASGVEPFEAAVGDDFVRLWQKDYSLTNVRLYDVDFHAGDVIKAEFSTSTSGGNLTIVTADAEGTSKETIINTVNRLASGQKTVTLTQDAPKLKLYVTYPDGNPPVKITIYRKITGDSTLTERAYKNSGDIASLDDRVSDLEDSTAADHEDIADISEIIGDTYYKEVKRIDGFAVRASTVLFDVDFHAGDVIKMVYTTNDPGKMLTVVTYVNDANTDYFVQTGSTSASGESEITITANATKLKVFATFTNGLSGAHVDLLFLRKEDASDLGNTLVAQASENKTSTDENRASIDYVEESIPCGILGEAMIKNNEDFIPQHFLGIVMLDNNYKYFSVANIKRIIDAMASVGLNCLELGFGGSGRGLGFALNDMTFTVRGVTYDMSDCLLTSTGKYLTEANMEEIIQYAAANGIEIMPSFNVISHASAILAKHPEFWYKGAYNYSLNVDSRDACDFAVGLAEMYGKWFAEHGCHHWNLCADEFSVGFAEMQAEGEYQYADAINRVAYALSRYRYILHCWNDPICANDSAVPFINRRMVVHYWAKKTTGYGTMASILADGHPVVNANVSIYWVENAESQVTEQQIRAFDITQFADGSTYANPAGAAFCVWIGNREDPVVDDDGLAITDEILPLVVAFGETIENQHS